MLQNSYNIAIQQVFDFKSAPTDFSLKLPVIWCLHDIQYPPWLVDMNDENE